MSSTRRGSTARRGAPSPGSSATTAAARSTPSRSSSTVSPESTDCGGKASASLPRPAVAALLDQQPLFLTLRLDESPLAAQLESVQLEEQLALGDPLFGRQERHPEAAVPEHHGTAAVLPLGDHALEIGVLDGVV